MAVECCACGKAIPPDASVCPHCGSLSLELLPQYGLMDDAESPISAAELYDRDDQQQWQMHFQAGLEAYIDQCDGDYAYHREQDYKSVVALPIPEPIE